MSTVFTKSKIHVQNKNNTLHFLLKQWNINVNHNKKILYFWSLNNTNIWVLLNILLCVKYINVASELFESL